jgi:predicted DNA-binding transcriptional regulator YafY
LSRIAAALGGPIEREMRKAIGERPADLRRGFLQVREVLPSDSDRIGGIFTFLKDAASACARVEFSYIPSRGARGARRAEPYHVVARSGRYYLVAYDIARRDWRYFALDAIIGPLRKDGTFSPRPVPERFLAERAVGWIRGATTLDTTFRLSPVVVATVMARTWQPEQRIVPLADGGAEITLSFDDAGEAVRWALSFGAEAVVIGPPEAVALARQMVDRIVSAYAGGGGMERKELTA